MSFENQSQAYCNCFFEAYKNFLDVLQKDTSNLNYIKKNAWCFINLQIFKIIYKL